MFRFIEVPIVYMPVLLFSSLFGYSQSCTLSVNPYPIRAGYLLRQRRDLNCQNIRWHRAVLL